MIEIIKTSFEKQGSLYVEYEYNGISGSLVIDATMKDFDDMLPPDEAKYTDDDDLWCATLDKYHNLHWHGELNNGNVIARCVYIEPIIIKAIEYKHY